MKTINVTVTLTLKVKDTNVSTVKEALELTNKIVGISELDNDPKIDTNISQADIFEI
mgnify:CR=1 FL=1